MKNYYEILQVDRKATPDIIKGIYKLHIKNNHPDLFQGEEMKKAEERIKEINEAYEVLSDEIKRAEYDSDLEAEDMFALEELKHENEQLKNTIVQLQMQEVNTNNKASNVYIENERETRNNFEPQEEYVYDENITERNNTMYLMKLLWKERLMRVFITIALIIAFVVALYKTTGVNILKVIFTGGQT